MTLTEPVEVLLETGVLGTFEKADESGDPVETRGLLENAESERATGTTTRSQAAWQFTAATADVGTTFGEGDSLTIDGTEYEILDTMAKDEALTLFLLATPN